MSKGDVLHGRGMEREPMRAESWSQKLERLAPTEREEAIEEAMAQGEIPEAELLPFVAALSGEVQARLARFLEQVIDDAKYVRIFHECFPVLSKEEKAEVIRRCTVVRPTSCARVAPFVKLKGISIEEPDPHFIHPNRERELLSSTKLDSVMKEQVVSGMIAFADFHPDAVEVVQDNLQTILESQRWMFLLPHLSHLIEKGWITEEVVRDKMNDAMQSYGRNVFSTFLTDQDWTDLQSIKHRSSSFQHAEKIWGRRQAHGYEMERFCRGQGEKGARLVASVLRTARRLVGTDLRWKELVSDSFGERIAKMEENDIPMFAVADAWVKGEKEWRGVLRAWVSRPDLWGFPVEAFKSLELLPEADAIVKEAVRAFSSASRRTQEPSYVIGPIVRGWGTLTKSVAQKTSHSLAEVITRNAPETWLINLDVAKKVVGKDVSEFLQSTTRRPQLFLCSIEELMASTKRGWLQEEGVGSQEVIALAEKALMRDPLAWFQPRVRKQVEAVVPAEVIQRVIDAQFAAPANRWFVSEYARDCIERTGAIEQLRSVLERDARLLKFVVNYTRSPLETMRKLYGSPEAELRMIPLIEGYQWRSITHSDEFLKTCVAWPAVRKVFYLQMLQKGKCEELIRISEDLSLKMSGEESYYRSAELVILKRKAQSEQRELDYYLTQGYSATDATVLNARANVREANLALERETIKQSRKRREVDPALKESYATMQQEIQAALQEAVEQNPALVFSTTVFRFLGANAEGLVRKHFDTVYRRNPVVALGRDQSTSRICRIIGERYYYEALGQKMGDAAYQQLRISELRYAIWPELQRRFDQYAMPDTVFTKDFDTRAKAFAKLYDVVSQCAGFEFVEEEWNVQQKKATELVVPSYAEKNCPTDLRDLAFALTLTHDAPVFLEMREDLKGASPAERLEAVHLCARLVRDGKGMRVAPKHEDPLVWLRREVVPVLSKEFELVNTPTEAAQVPFIGWNAFAVYFRSARSTRSGELQEKIQQTAGRVLDGTYFAYRQWGKSESPTNRFHQQQALIEMQEQGFLPTGLSLEQYESWNQDIETDLETELSLHISDVQTHLRRLLQLSVADGHIPADVVSSEAIEDAAVAYKDVRAPLIDLSQRMEQIRQTTETMRREVRTDPTRQSEIDRHDEEYKRLQREVAQYRERFGGTIDRFMALRVLNGFQQVSLRDLDSRQISLPNSKERMPFNRAFTLLRKSFEMYPEFSSDLQRLERACEDARTQLLGKGDGRSTRVRLEANDRVSFDSLVRIGADPVSSCQHYDGGSENEGLLSTVIDPNVRLIRVHQETGGSVARSVMRLLSDEKGNPHLFLERLYSVNPHEMVDRLVVELARKKAAAMGIPLHTDEISGDEETFQDVEPVRLYSHGSRSTAVYTDAGGGSSPEGIFQVDAMRTIAV